MLMSLRRIHVSSFLLIVLLASQIAFAALPAGVSTGIDALMKEQIKPDGAGAAVLVSRNGIPVYRKAYGMADIELKASMAPEDVFELGSITKQFTAVGILMLMEQG